MANLFNQLGLFGANAAQMMPQPVQPAKLGLLDRLGRQLVPGDSQWSPSDDERKAMMKRGLLEAGLTMLATPTGAGNSPVMGIASGLLAGKDAMQRESVDMRNRALGLDLGAGLSEWNAMTRGLSPDDRQKAARIKLGLDGRASGAAVKYMVVEGSDGRKRVVAFDPNDPNKTQLANGEKVISTSDTPPGVPQVTPEQISATARKMFDSGMPKDEVDKWFMQQMNAYELSKGMGNSPYVEPQAPQYNPTPLAGGMMTSRAPEEQAALTREAELKAELGYKPQIAGAEAEAKANVDAQYAPQLAGAKVTAEEDAKRKAQAVSDAPKAVATADEMLSVIDKAINHPGRKYATGASAIAPWDYAAGTSAKDFMAVQKQLEGQAFLQAFEQLKGGGQITEIEGQKATQAKARLDRAQSEGEYLQALRELRAIVEGAKKRALEKAGYGPPPPGLRGSTQPKRIKSKQDYDALPAGTQYIGPDGKVATKGSR